MDLLSNRSDRKRKPVVRQESKSNKKIELEIKLEALDEEENNTLVDPPTDDVKPDINELQQEILRQQQQSQTQEKQLKTITTTTTSTCATPVAKRLFILGDLTCLTHLNGNSSVVLQCDSLENSAGGSEGRKIITAASTSSTIAANSTPATSALKFLNNLSVKDKIDLQESDIDEEGYSDIDFDEDDDDELVEDDDEIDLYDPTWTEQPIAPRMVHEFETKQPDVGLEGRPKSLDPIFYFDTLLGNRTNFFNLLAVGSNARAQELLQSSSASATGQTYLKEISCDEMKIFVGVCLQMSTMRLAHIADYWNEQSDFGFQGFSEKMSLNRFQMLMCVLNFEKLSKRELFEPKADRKVPTITTAECSTRDALVELNPLLDYFNQRMQEVYKCGQRLVINEPLMLWKGKLNWVREMSEKFRCNAVTLHFLTEHTGLLLKILPDVECNERKQHVRNSKLLAKQRANLAIELLKEKLRKGHTVYVSKYYGSYGLGYELANQSTYCTGLLDNKRYGNCKQLIMTKLKKHLFATKYATIDKTSIMMGKWRRRNKCVYFYSSDCLAIYHKETSARNSDMRLKIIKELDWQLQQPSNIRDYMLSYQILLERNEIKWDKQLAIYVFNLMVLNAFILYTMYAQFGRSRVIELHLKDTTKLKSYAEFRQDVVLSLLRTNEFAAKEISDETSSDDEKDDDGAARRERHYSKATTAATYKKLIEIDHMPMVIPRRKGKVLKKKCRICRKGGMLTFSKLCCEVCPGQPGLCETPCFKIWHDQLKKSIEAGEQIKTRTFGKSGEKTIYF